MPREASPPITRRRLVQIAGLAGAAALAGRVAPFAANASAASADRSAFEVRADAAPESTFSHSVASGDPSATGVVLWTRIAPSAVKPGIPLALEVARDAAFSDVAWAGTVPATEIRADADFTVRVDLDGLLASDRFYHYRFVYDGVASRAGRCRTLPAEGSSPDKLRFALLTCQDYRDGYYGAYDHVAADDVDFVLHLGDFIYEYAGEIAGWPDRAIELPSGATVASSLADYRYLHAKVRSDPSLQRAMERHTFILGWDDHEVGNDRYWDYAADRPVLPDHPQNANRAFIEQLTRDGIRAWCEWIPARVEHDPGATHLHAVFKLNRAFKFGDLAEILVTDERLFRTQPPADPIPFARPFGSLETPERYDPSRTMLGATQRAWFMDRVARSGARWKLWANEVLVMPLRAGREGASVYLNYDMWDGYEHERRLLMRMLRDRSVRNFVALTGDLHTYIAGYLQVSYDDPQELASAANLVGVELMTPAITSANLSEIAGGPANAEAEAFLSDPAVRALNPHFAWFDSSHFGYSIVEVTRDGLKWEAYAVDKTTTAGKRETLRVLRVPDGKVEIESVEGGPLPAIAPGAAVAQRSPL